MVNLTLEDIINIHDEIGRRFNITPGIKDKGLLDSIAERPEQNIYSHIPFPDIHSKCASLMEAIIKWHPFIDGNKRTGLAVASAYMYKNKHALLLPLSAVRFSVLVARNEKNFQEITEWVSKMSAGSLKEYKEKMAKHHIIPALKVFKLLDSEKKEERERGNKILSEWLAYDIYPEYVLEGDKVFLFLRDLLKRQPVSNFFE